MDIRPRTTGEILDDAIRLTLADAPLLYALTGLFTVPAAVAVLLLLCLPAPESWLLRCILPAVVALTVPLVALGSGACQAVFRRRAEGNPVTLGGCLADALRRSLDHLAARLTAWVFPLIVMFALGGATWVLLRLMFLTAEVLPPGAVFALLLVVVLGLQTFAVFSGTAVHAIIAEGEEHWFGAWRAAMRETRRQMGKVAALAFSRPVLWLLVCLNVHLVFGWLLWAGEALAGLDLALVSLICTLGNPTYRLALGLFCWLLLVPYLEASNYLLHVDARARFEGLDLWYRVRRLFPAVGKGPAVNAGLVAALLVCGAAGAVAADPRLEAVRGARKEMAAITQEVKAAEPWKGGKPWVERLNAVATRLDEDGGNRAGGYRWFREGLRGFEREDRAGALRLLAGLDGRLSLIEEGLADVPAEAGGEENGPSKADLKSLLPPQPSKDDVKKGPPDSARHAERKRPVRRDDSLEEENGPRRRGSGAVGPQPGGSFGPLILNLLAAVLLAALAVALIRLFLLWLARRTPKEKPAAKSETDAPSLESLLSQAEKYGTDGMWRRADDLARAGQFLAAVRALYLAVLALLHKADLIRYAPTRTNGEYVRQLRSRETVCGPFRGLTHLFDVNWYGERSCEPADYDSCRRLAEAVRTAAKDTD